MRNCAALLSLILLSSLLAIAQEKQKEKTLLPPDVLQAKTVLVLVDPDTGVSLSDPNGNKTARRDVEIALLHWGRFTFAPADERPDLVITVRKGNGKTVRQTVGGVPVNNRPVILEGDDDVLRVGVQHGHLPKKNPNDPNDNRPDNADDNQNTGPAPRTEIGPAEDMFVVYQGSVQNAPLWRYTAKGALRSPNVPAVEEFRKLIEETEKQQAKQPKKSTP